MNNNEPGDRWAEGPGGAGEGGERGGGGQSRVE